MLNIAESPSSSTCLPSKSYNWALHISVNTSRIFFRMYHSDNPRANGAKRRSGRKPGAKVTNRA